MTKQVIACCSFKGGTAKTSITLHLGAALSKYYRKKVLLVDFDAQANLTTGLGFDPDEFDSLASVLHGKKSLSDIVQDTGTKNLSLIPADTWLERVEVTGELASDRYSHERLKEIVDDCDYDYILIDTPPSLCWLTESALIASDHALVCATPEFYSIKGLERLSEFIDSIGDRHNVDVLGVALSFWNARGKSNQAFLDIIERTFPEKTLKSRIRRDIAVNEASIYGKPVFLSSPKSRAAQDFRSMTKELVSLLKGAE